MSLFPLPLAGLRGGDIPRFLLGSRELFLLDVWEMMSTADGSERNICILGESGAPFRTNLDQLRKCTSIFLLRDGEFQGIIAATSADGRSVACQLTGDRRRVLVS